MFAKKTELKIFIFGWVIAILSLKGKIFFFLKILSQIRKCLLGPPIPKRWSDSPYLKGLKTVTKKSYLNYFLLFHQCHYLLEFLDLLNMDHFTKNTFLEHTHKLLHLNNFAIFEWINKLTLCLCGLQNNDSTINPIASKLLVQELKQISDPELNNWKFSDF